MLIDSDSTLFLLLEYDIVDRIVDDSILVQITVLVLNNLSDLIQILSFSRVEMALKVASNRIRLDRLIVIELDFNDLTDSRNAFDNFSRRSVRCVRCTACVQH